MHGIVLHSANLRSLPVTRLDSKWGTELDWYPQDPDLTHYRSDIRQRQDFLRKDNSAAKNFVRHRKSEFCSVRCCPHQSLSIGPRLILFFFIWQTDLRQTSRGFLLLSHIQDYCTPDYHKKSEEIITCVVKSKYWQQQVSQKTTNRKPCSNISSQKVRWTLHS